MKRSIRIIAPAFVFSGLLATSAFAADDLTKDQVKAKLEAAGYTNVSGIHKESNHFDAKTGAITPESEEAEASEHKDKKF